MCYFFAGGFFSNQSQLLWTFEKIRVCMFSFLKCKFSSHKCQTLLPNQNIRPFQAKNY